MTEEDRAAGTEEEVPQGSVFGNLPGSRPGVRSPRRNRDSQSRPAEQVETEPESPPPTAAKPTPQRRAAGATPRRPEPAPGREPEPEGRGGIEDAAWAGVAAAAEAATIGVRIANRAFEALRDAVDRR